MPAPVLKEWDLAEIARRTLFLQQNANPGITYEDRVPTGEFRLMCDSRQVGQALTNLMLNAADSVKERLAGSNGGNPGEGAGEIILSVTRDAGRISIVVEDNGLGLPKDQRHRLTDPYVTTKSTGTGLGLAIVRKIMEDHGGELVLEDRPGGGARVSLIFRAAETQSIQESDTMTTAGHAGLRKISPS
jgi:two-component system nitrogen regulation sensor histidine kinase NtrY